MDLGLRETVEGACRKTCLHEDHGLDVSLTAYEPGLRMLPHEHENHQVSYLLAGEMLEEVGAEEKDICTLSRGVKPAGCRHHVRMGPNGALILSVNFHDSAFEAPVPDLFWGWNAFNASPSGTAHDGSLLGLLRCGDQTLRSELAWDLVSVVDNDTANDNEPVQPWLKQVRERINDEPEGADLVSAAKGAGVHPVHLSRSFKKAFGIPPSLYRARVRMACGVQEILKGASLADASFTAGFADQSHFTRTLTREMGLSPKRLQKIFT